MKGIPIPMYIAYFYRILDNNISVNFCDLANRWVVYFHMDDCSSKSLNLCSLHVKDNIQNVSGAVEDFELNSPSGSFLDGFEKAFPYILESFMS